MIKTYCDLCRKEIPNYYGKNLVTFKTSVTISTMDTCDECRADWFNNYNEWYPKHYTSDDCISRSEALKYFEECEDSDSIKVKYAIQHLKGLQSVIPIIKEKVAKWTHRNDDKYDWLECPCCGFGNEGEITRYDGVACSYCPRCGLKLLE